MRMRLAVPLVAAVFSLSFACSVARADEAGKEAAAHFKRAVTLYGEADYHAALIEFKRAYDLSPTAQVLYDIGQTYYQLQDYANALPAFEKYLASAPTSAPHRKDAETTLDTLRSRVGSLNLLVEPTGSEIFVDDELVGTAPLARPRVVSIGRRKISVTHTGHVAATKIVEVAGGDKINVDIALDEIPVAAAPAPAVVPVAPAAAPPLEDKSGPRPLTIGAWVATALLAAGWATTGFLALSASSDLKTARDRFGETRADLDSKASSVTNLALISDVLGVLTLVAGAASIGITLTSPHKGSESGPHVMLSPAGAGLLVHGSF